MPVRQRLLIFFLIIYYCVYCYVWFNIVGVIYLTADIDRIRFPSGQFSVRVSATDGGHPPLSAVAVLRVVVDGDNKTAAASGGVAGLLRSALSSNRLAIVLSVLLSAVVLTIAVILLFTVVIDRRRCRLPDKLADCSCLPTRVKRRKTDRSVVDRLRTSCCCCMDDSRHQRKRKPALCTDDATVTTEGVSGSSSTVFTAAVRRVGASNQSL